MSLPGRYFINGIRCTMKNHSIFEGINMPGDSVPHSSWSDEVEWLSQAFHDCLLRWQKVKTYFSVHGFYGEEEEILFFKYTKPRFIGFLNYYSRRYQNLVFRPPAHTEQINFYKNELVKSEKFRSDHSEFYMYYTNGCRDRDNEYFRRAQPDAPYAFEKIYNGDKRLTSAKDGLVAKLIANGLYHSYLLQLMFNSTPCHKTNWSVCLYSMYLVKRRYFMSFKQT